MNPLTKRMRRPHAGRRGRRHTILAVSCATALLTASTSCSTGGEAEGTSGGEGDSTLVIGSAIEPGSLHILRDGDDGNELINWSITQPLVERTSDGFEPVLAEELPVQDEEDPKRWHVKLREGVSFTNGEAFDAEAVKQNVDLVADPDFGSTINGVEVFATAEVVDDYSVDLITKEPDPYLLYRLSTLRFIPPKASADADAYAESPIGTGPYEFVKWDKGQRIVLKKNEDYWGGDEAQLDEVEFRFIPEAGARLAALDAGEIDMATTITPEDATRVPQVIESDGYAKTSLIRINLDMPPYDDPSFRLALAHAINLDSINENLMNGQFAPAQCQVVPPGEFGAVDSLEAYSYDPEEAKRLLSEVDLPADFSVKMVSTTGIQLKDREIGQAIAADWEAIGLDVDVDFLASDPWLEDVLAGGAKTSADGPGPLTYIDFDHHSNYAQRYTSRVLDRTNPLATIGSAYPDLDPTLKTALTSEDEAEAESAFQKLNELSCDEALVLPILYMPDQWGASTAVEYSPGPGLVNRIHLEDVRVHS